MKRNSMVKVFQMPITDEKFEGEARLMQHHASEDDLELGERWTVRFSDGALVDRWVHERNLVCETVAA